MNDDLKNWLREYEAKKLAIKELERDVDALKGFILPLLPEDAKIATDTGTFTMESRIKWTYSPMVQEAERDLKDAKKREEADGTAVAGTGDPFLVYRENKD